MVPSAYSTSAHTLQPAITALPSSAQGFLTTYPHLLSSITIFFPLFYVSIRLLHFQHVLCCPVPSGYLIYSIILQGISISCPLIQNPASGHLLLEASLELLCMSTHSHSVPLVGYVLLSTLHYNGFRICFIPINYGVKNPLRRGFDLLLIDPQSLFFE